MLQLIDGGLPATDSPVSNAILADGHLYTVQVPRDIETGQACNKGDITEQTHNVLKQLKKTLEMSGGTLKDVAQVTVYLIDQTDAPGMNAVYREYFSAPYPNRATVVVSALMGESRRIEIVVHAHPGSSAANASK